MGTEDMARQALNVARMRMLGTQVVGVDFRQPHAQGRHQRACATGHQRATTHYLLGSVLGAHPYPRWSAIFNP